MYFISKQLWHQKWHHFHQYKPLIIRIGADFYHISMVETDYDTYAAYVECDDATERIFPVISSTTPDLNQALVDRLILQFISLGLPMDNFVRVVHDDNCQYFL